MTKYLNLKKYIRFSFNKLLKLISPFIKIWEKKYIKKYSSEPLKHQPVFIIGAPRTGSTILYQTITNQLDVLYVDNLICRLNKNFFFGFWISNKIFKQKAHNCFNSNHGNTSKCGYHAPSECGNFWYRWLPTDRHFIDYDDINEEMIREIREEITAVINYFDKPLVFNNNNIALRIKLIKLVFPNAKYIIADREPFFVAQSLLVARKTFFSNYDRWWSIMPPNYIIIKEKPFTQQVVQQHYFINKQMYDDLNKLVGETNYYTVEYSRFARDKNMILKKIICLIDYNERRNKMEDNNVYESKKRHLKSEIVIALENEIERLDWNDYSSKT